MSDYGSHRHSTRTREPEYVETEETFIQRGSGASGNRDLVVRQRDDYDDDRDYRRPSYRDDYGPPARARSSHYHGRGHEDDYYDDYYDDRPRRRRSKYDDDDYYSDDYDRPPRRERRKSTAGKIIEDLGLAGVASTVMNKVRSRSQSRRRGGSYSDDSRDGSSRYRSHSQENRKKWQQAAKAAVITGVIEAVRSRKEPGGWTGEKGQRIATAALGAAGIDGFLDRDPDKKSKRHIVESVVGGLAANRLANGPREASSSRGRSRSRSRSIVDQLRSRSRSILSRGRSQSRGRDPARSRSRSRGVKEIAALGGAAAIGKAIYDRVRSKSRGRLRRDASVSSEDSYVPSRRQNYQARDLPGEGGGPGGPGGPDEYSRGRSAEAPAEGGTVDRKRSGSASSEDTDDLKQSYKKTRGKELLTAALASVATIHAAHGVYSSMVASEKRHQKVMEGEMQPETARKLKSKNMLQDAAAVGIAALSIKSAFSEWKEMNEKRKEKHEIFARRRKRIKARERRERELKMGGGYPTDAVVYGNAPLAGAAADYYRGGPPVYGDANPYGQSYSNIPPPPVGGPPPNRYA